MSSDLLLEMASNCVSNSSKLIFIAKNRRRASVGGVITLFFVWVSVGGHLPASVLMGDFCVAVDKYTSESSQSSNNDSGAEAGLNLILNCASNSVSYYLRFFLNLYRAMIQC